MIYGIIYVSQSRKENENDDNSQNPQGGGKILGYVAVMALFTIAMLSQSMADETISVDTQLSADMTVDGTLYLKNGATLDLNGHNLSVKALARPAVENEDVPGYSFIEYIEANGSQWLYSDYTPAGSDRVEMKLELTGVPGSSAWWIFFCTRALDRYTSMM